MRIHILSLFLTVFVIALVESKSRLRTINLHGFGTGIVNADPLNLEFMDMPVTVGGKGQGDIKGAMAVDIPVAAGLEKYFPAGQSADFIHDSDFYGGYPNWLKHHSRYVAGENVYGVKPLKHLDSEERIIAVRGGKKPTYDVEGGQGGLYILPLHTN